MTVLENCPRDAVLRLRGTRLSVTAEAWPFALANAAAIDAHWAARLAENPSFFNGVIHLLRSARIVDGLLAGELLPTDFKSFLYWRETGHRDDTVRDAFGSALLRSAEGHVVLGRQRPGNINSGLVYLPGGFIDARDVAPDNTIDMEASVLREVAEETGIRSAELMRAPGVILTSIGPNLSVAVELRSALPAAELRARILEHLAADQDPELEDAVIVRSRADLAELPLAPYARQLLESREIFPA